MSAFRVHVTFGNSLSTCLYAGLEAKLLINIAKVSKSRLSFNCIALDF